MFGTGLRLVDEEEVGVIGASGTYCAKMKLYLSITFLNVFVLAYPSSNNAMFRIVSYISLAYSPTHRLTHPFAHSSIRGDLRPDS